MVIVPLGVQDFKPSLGISWTSQSWGSQKKEKPGKQVSPVGGWRLISMWLSIIKNNGSKDHIITRKEVIICYTISLWRDSLERRTMTNGQLRWRLNFHRHTLSDPVQGSGGQAGLQQGACNGTYSIIGTTRLEMLSVRLQSYVGWIFCHGTQKRDSFLRGPSSSKQWQS